MLPTDKMADCGELIMAVNSLMPYIPKFEILGGEERESVCMCVCVRDREVECLVT